MEKINFFGTLKDFDTENISKNDFKKLIDKTVIVFDYDLTGEELEEEKKYIITNPNEIYSLNSFCFYFNFKSYSFNHEIFNQMLKKDSEKIENFSDATDIILNIDFEIEKEIDLERKIRILDYHYEKYLNYIKKNPACDLISDYLLFKNGTKTSYIATWFELYKENILGDSNATALIDFLKGKEYFYNKDLKHDWEIIYKVSKICDFCSSKRQLLINPNYAIEVIDNSKSIFKNDGFDMFKHIVTNHKEYSPSFFSYVFFFLADRNKLIDSNQKNSNKYIDLIYKNYGLRMSKIIQTDTNSRKKDTMHNLFEQYLKTYSNKNE